MTNHQSSVLSVAIIIAGLVAVVGAVGYRIGRTHAAWRDWSKARRDVPVKRGVALVATRGAALGVLLVLAVLLAAGYGALQQ